MSHNYSLLHEMCLMMVVKCSFLFTLQTILTHSRSRVVLQLLTEAARANKWFKVYVTESLPDRAGCALLHFSIGVLDNQDSPGKWSQN